MNKHGQLKQEILMMLDEAKKNHDHFLIDQLKYRLKLLKRKKYVSN